MSFRVSINESNNEVLIQQPNYVLFNNNTIKVRNAFSENGIYEFSYTGSIVDFPVPTSGTYKIEAWGARGGSSSSTTGPLGAYSKSFVLLNKDERIKILVGEKGYRGYNSGNFIYEGGGGGGTFVAKGNTALCVAGGGGSFTYHSYSTVQSHACGQATQLSVDIGYGRASLKMGGKGTASSGGGGGFEGNGGDGTNWGKGGNSFINGGARQTQRTYEGSAYGGFGGGASNCGGNHAAAGGGGYTGGSASEGTYTQGGGGGSYFEGFYYNETSLAISGCNTSIPTNPGTNGNGFVRMTFMKIIPSRTVNKKVSCSSCKTPISWTFIATLISQ